MIDRSLGKDIEWDPSRTAGLKGSAHPVRGLVVSAQVPNVHLLVFSLLSHC